jgi:protease-4
LQLVDKLGSFDDAIKAAAALAKLEKYDVVDMKERKTTFEMFLSNLSETTVAKFGGGKQYAAHGAVAQLVRAAEAQVKFFSEFNDPNAAYARCMTCE